jgi:hypothetical protein
VSILLPALPVPNFVLFPGCTVSLQFGFPALQDQLRLAQKHGGKIVVAHSLHGSEGWVPAKIGCLADVRSIKETPHGLQAGLAGISRIRLISQRRFEGRLYWECEQVALQKWSKKKLPELAGLPELVRACRGKLPAELWLDVAAFHLPGLPLEQKLALLAEPDPSRRYYQLLECTRAARSKPKISMN